VLTALMLVKIDAAYARFAKELKQRMERRDGLYD
jgi:hypothetical protein